MQVTTSKPHAAVLALTALLAACAAGPDYQRPDIALPDHYQATSGPTASNIDLSRWWDSFDDPVLSQLINQALATNLDLAAAQARVAQARAAAGEANAATLPQLNLDGAVARQRQSLVSPLGLLGRQYPQYSRDQTWQQLGLGASWELDLAGGLHRQSEAMQAQAEAAEATHAGTRISVAAETADAYFQLRSNQAAEVLLQSQIAADQQYVTVMRNRSQQGVATDRDVDDAAAQLAQDQSLQPALHAQWVKQANRLDVLLGNVPGTGPASLRSSAQPGWQLPPLPGDLHPAQLLQRRPDIIAAERRLAASTTRISLWPAYWVLSGWAAATCLPAKPSSPPSWLACTGACSTLAASTPKWRKPKARMSKPWRSTARPCCAPPRTQKTP